MSNIRLDYNNMMADVIGKEGFTAKDFESVAERSDFAVKYFNEKAGSGMMGWTKLPFEQDAVVDDIIETAETVRRNFKNFVVLGIGGSALGPIAVFQALCHMHHNELDRSERGGAPKFYVEDNVDPERMVALLETIDLKKTCFNVITKSGSTSETMTQYLIIKNALERTRGCDAKKQIITTTSAESGNLIKISKAEGYKTFYIPDGVGGRFSEMCPVGLFPAAVLGIDIKKMLKGAADMYNSCVSASNDKNMALKAAELQYIAINKGKNISVMMPYADGLKYFSDWYAQLWGESLGKNKLMDGTPCNIGQTPVKALGVTDQHSQIQLYAEGPADKVITFLAVDKYRKTVTIPDGCEEFPNVNFLCGHTMNELIDAERKATEYAVTKAGKVNHTIYLSEINEANIGALMMLLELKTAYCGFMLNIEPFNQPGVEEGKNATYALLGRPGYEEKREELNNGAKKSDKYIM